MKIINYLLYPHYISTFGIFGAIAGAVVGGLFAKKAADKAADATEDANQAQIASAKEQMEFQERMSNTAHQRQIEDLRKAGLNPILSAKYGGASTPSGAQANIQSAAPVWQSYGQQMSSIASNAGIQFSAQAIQQKQTDANVEQIAQNINNLKASESLTNIQKLKVGAEINSIQEQAKYLAEQTKGLSYKNALAFILKEYYQNNSMDLVAKDMGITTVKYIELLESYFKDITGLQWKDLGTDKYWEKINPIPNDWKIKRNPFGESQQ